MNVDSGQNKESIQVYSDENGSAGGHICVRRVALLEDKTDQAFESYRV